MTTKQDTKYEVLHEYFWHRLNNKEKEFTSFNFDNFAGLVLASSYSLKLAEPTSDGIELVNTTFDNFLASQYINTDTGFDSYDEIIGDIEV